MTFKMCYGKVSTSTKRKGRERDDLCEGEEATNYVRDRINEQTDEWIKRERRIVMGAKETDRRPRRENCSESPARILGQTEETRSRRCNGLSLSSLLSLSRSRSYRSLPLDSPHGWSRTRRHTLVFPIFLLKSPVYQSEYPSTFALSHLSRARVAECLIMQTMGPRFAQSFGQPSNAILTATK